jgi:hypothetical protein
MGHWFRTNFVQCERCLCSAKVGLMEPIEAVAYRGLWRGLGNQSICGAARSVWKIMNAATREEAREAIRQIRQQAALIRSAIEETCQLIEESRQILAQSPKPGFGLVTIPNVGAPNNGAAGSSP